MLKDNFKHDVLDLSSSVGGRSAEWNEIGFSLLMITCVSFEGYQYCSVAPT
jgi:hypothetical protein